MQKKLHEFFPMNILKFTKNIFDKGKLRLKCKFFIFVFQAFHSKHQGVFFLSGYEVWVSWIQVLPCLHNVVRLLNIWSHFLQASVAEFF